MSSILYRAHSFISKSDSPLENSVSSIARHNIDNKTVKKIYDTIYQYIKNFIIFAFGI